MPDYNESVLAHADSHGMPDRIKALPISPAGFPVPWFVQWFDGDQPCDPCAPGSVPDFRVVDSRKVTQALRQHRCWVCGEMLGIHKAFVIGPMCSISRTISEPPGHRDCAIYSATACPFLTKPRMKRNERDLPVEGKEPGGIAIKRNPGVACVWVTKSFRSFRPQHGNEGLLFSLGQPLEVLWFAHGRTATRAEIMESIDSGYPLLQDMAKLDGPEALKALERQRALTVETLVPR